MNNPLLSVLIVSHNQSDCVSRCLESVLAQELSYPFEVIVSDDNSTDGTWEILNKYVQDYPGLVYAFRCNSDDCAPVNRSERCGWNKLNAYKHSRGKYFVNMDADDYLRSTDIYQCQIDELERHPDCSMCQQRVLQVENGKDLSTGISWPVAARLYNDVIVTAEDTIVGKLRGLNQSYLIRKNPNEDPAALYGKWYDDTVITLHHLQFGPAIFIDRADYVWVQYNSSINSSLKGDDKLALYALLPFHHAVLIPGLRNYFIREDNLQLHHLIKSLLKKTLSLSKETEKYISQFDGYIFRCCCGIGNKQFFRLRIAFMLLFIKRNLKKDFYAIDKAIFSLLL